MSEQNNIERIEIVAEGLGSLTAEVIFIGGACTQFYVTDSALRQFRQTKDVDFLVEIYSYKDLARFGKELRKLGFKHDTSPGAPIIRWVYNGILVDAIPDKSSIVGFTEGKWFVEGRKRAVKQLLPSGQSINILPFAFYIATKLEAFTGRGRGDFLGNHDIEDVITLIDGNEDLSVINSAPSGLKNYLSVMFKDLLSNDAFLQSITGHIGYEFSAAERAGMVIDKMKAVFETD